MISFTRFVCLGAAAFLAAGPAWAATTPPKPLRTVAPVYPTELLSNPVSGRAVVQFVVNAAGRVEDPIVKSADHELFADAAVEAVMAWEFEPATKDGQAISRKVSLPIDFAPNPLDIMNRALGRTVFAQFSEEPVSLRTLKQRPRPLFRPAPAYPKSKKGSGEEKRIRVRFLIGKDGATYNPEILDEVEGEWKISAIATVAAMKFEPMKHQGELVVVEVPGFPVLITENPPRPGQGGRGGRGGGGEPSRGR